METAVKSKVVPIEKIEPNAWNPNRQSDFMLERTRRSIKRFGFIDPVTCRARADGQLEIIDGEHRYRAAKELGITSIPVVVIEADDTKAKALTDVMNNLRGSPDPVLQADLIRSLADADAELLEVLPYSQAELQAMLTPVDWASLDQNEPEKPEKEPESKAGLTFSVALDQDQLDTVTAALAAAKTRLENGGDAGALVFICQRFLAEAKRGRGKPSSKV